MNGSLNSGGRRSVGLRLPGDPPHEEMREPEAQTPLEAARETLERSAGEGPKGTFAEAIARRPTSNPVILLGQMRLDAGIVVATLSELPKAHAHYESRLRSIIASCSSIARACRELIEDETRRQEGSV
jgi:hypothetical protein